MPAWAKKPHKSWQIPISVDKGWGWRSAPVIPAMVGSVTNIGGSQSSLAWTKSETITPK
jgi:hypothetical protein